MKGFTLGGKNLRPGVRCGARQRHAVEIPGEHVGRAGASAHVSRPRRTHARLRSLGAPRAEFPHWPAARRRHHARRLRGHRGLEVDDREEVGLDHLGLGHRRRHLQDRLAAEDQRPLRDGAHLTRKPELAQVTEKGIRNGAESRLLAQEPHVIVGEAQVFQVPERRIEPRRHQVSALGRQLAHKKLERGPAVDAMLKVGRRHGELVEVHEQGAIVVSLEHPGRHLTNVSNDQYGFRLKACQVEGDYGTTGMGR